MTRACALEMTPSACAAATCGNTGSSGPPVKSVRGPSSFAARTRDAASDGDTRKHWTNKVAVVRAPTSAWASLPTSAETRA